MSTSHVALVGPTASGKSMLALEIARRMPEFEIVSVDSMQVYRGMDIGTAKPTFAERAEVVHHLLDLVDSTEDFTLTDFQAAARGVLAGIEERGHRALLVGGTGLYLQAVIDGLRIPGQFPEQRAELEKEPNTRLLHTLLQDLDPTAAARMEPTNRRRVVRALEVTVGSGQPFSSFGPGISAHPDVSFRLLGLWLPRSVGAQRIEERVEAMIADGWIEEVETLQKRGPLSKTASQALGYPELLAYLSGSMSQSEAVEEIIRRTRAFARRQRVWFRRDPRVTWVGTANDPALLLPALLRQCELSGASVSTWAGAQGGELS